MSGGVSTTRVIAAGQKKKKIFKAARMI